MATMLLSLKIVTPIHKTAGTMDVELIVLGSLVSNKILTVVTSMWNDVTEILWYQSLRVNA